MPNELAVPSTAHAMRRKRFEMPGRYAVAIECADDLTAEERSIMDAWFETEVNLLQRKRERGFTDEEAIAWEAEGLGITLAEALGKR